MARLLLMSSGRHAQADTHAGNSPVGRTCSIKPRRGAVSLSVLVGGAGGHLTCGSRGTTASNSSGLAAAASASFTTSAAALAAASSGSYNSEGVARISALMRACSASRE